MKAIIITICLLMATGCVTDPAQTQVNSQPENNNAVHVMVVGSYHMAGSTRNVIDIEVESVLTPARQRELAAIATSLEAFAPNVIATEREASAPDYYDPGYREFRPEMLTTKPNERVQLAYRIASNLSIDRVYGIDEHPSDGEPSYFPFGALRKHVEKTGQMEAFEALFSEGRRIADDFQASQSEKTMAELLYEVNTGPMSSGESYYRMFQFDRGEDQPASELQAYWFMRNAKIFSKLMQVTEPGDRVIVVFGAGHKFWLEHFVDETPGFVLVDPTPYLDKAVTASP